MFTSFIHFWQCVVECTHTLWKRYFACFGIACIGINMPITAFAFIWTDIVKGRMLHKHGGIINGTPTPVGLRGNESKTPVNPSTWCRGAIYNPAVPRNAAAFHFVRPNEGEQYTIARANFISLSTYNPFPPDRRYSGIDFLSLASVSRPFPPDEATNCYFA
jgi:hypothetical protein